MVSPSLVSALAAFCNCLLPTSEAMRARPRAAALISAVLLASASATRDTCRSDGALLRGGAPVAASIPEERPPGRRIAPAPDHSIRAPRLPFRFRPFVACNKFRMCTQSQIVIQWYTSDSTGNTPSRSTFYDIAFFSHIFSHPIHSHPIHSPSPIPMSVRIMLFESCCSHRSRLAERTLWWRSWPDPGTTPPTHTNSSRRFTTSHVVQLALSVPYPFPSQSGSSPCKLMPNVSQSILVEMVGDWACRIEDDLDADAIGAAECRVTQ